MEGYLMLKSALAAAAAILFLTGASPLPAPTVAPVHAPTMTKVQDDECKLQCIALCIKMGGGGGSCAIACMDTVCAYEPAVTNLPK
jgi:hypothetical protein